jgi:methionyl aminopeptidase
VIIKSKADLDGLKAIGKIVANCLQYMMKQAKPGMSTRELDDLGGKYLDKHGALSAPVSEYEFPGHTCISVNEEAAHGIPGKRILQPGDLVNIDVSASMNGFYADTGGSFILPPSTKEKEEVCRLARLALNTALKEVKTGIKINLIGKAIERVAKAARHTVIRNLGSHGVGRSLHEAPEFIAGFYDPNDSRTLSEGTVITIEPFISNGAHEVEDTGDGWTLANPGYLTAQYEHTLVVTKDGPILITVPD